MSTHALTLIRDRMGTRIRTHAVIYRHLDGYPEGHGRDLARFLAVTPPNILDDGGLLAAHLVAFLLANEKTGGRIELVEGADGHAESYRYIVTVHHAAIGTGISVTIAGGPEHTAITDASLEDYCMHVGINPYEEREEAEKKAAAPVVKPAFIAAVGCLNSGYRFFGPFTGTVRARAWLKKNGATGEGSAAFEIHDLRPPDEG